MLRWTASRLTYRPLTGLRRAATPRIVANTRSTLISSPLQHNVRRASTSTEPSLQIRTYEWVRYLAYRFAGACLALHVVTVYFFSSDITYGISMLPTLQSFGDYVLISKYYRRGRGVVVGDVISFKHPVREGEYAVKRVIGMEGDFVLYNTPQNSDAMIQVPQGHCWVVGDNMKYSRDSRMFGPLPIALIHGKVLAKWSSVLFKGFTWIENGLQPAQSDSDVD